MPRLSIAGVFLMSGRTKVEGLLTVSDTAVSLFEACATLLLYLVGRGPGAMSLDCRWFGRRGTP